MHNCQVCDEPNASKHYGSYCCSGCKGFFRRTVRYKRQYSCHNDKNCIIKTEYRNCCRACRFERCLSAGLNPLMVHGDRGNISTRGSAKNSPPDLKGGIIIKSEIQHNSDDDYEPKPIVRYTDGSKVKEEVLAVFDCIVTREEFEQDLEREYEHWHRVALDASKRMCEANNMALGSFRIIPEFDSSSATSVAKYYCLVERLCDDYYDSNAHHILSPASEFHHSIDVVAPKALVEPRSITARTKIDWTGRFFVDNKSMIRMWCRVVGHYIDWASHIPELHKLNHADRNLMLIDRSIPCIDILLGYRGLVNNVNGLVLSGGTYFPRNEAEQDLVDASIRPYLKRLTSWISDEFIEPARSINMSEAEYALLRLIVFFMPVPGLSPEGKAIVAKARNFYRGVLAQKLKAQFSSWEVDKMIERLSAIMGFLPVIETARVIEDEGFSVMTLFNVANMRGELTYELHVRKGFA